MIRFVAVAALAAVLANPLFAEKIERACLASERGAGKRELCGCIQDAANLTLTAADQRMAARFFGDPEKAEAVRASDRQQHAEFWRRYQNFGKTARAFCQG